MSARRNAVLLGMPSATAQDIANDSRCKKLTYKTLHTHRLQIYATALKPKVNQHNDCSHNDCCSCYFRLRDGFQEFLPMRKERQLRVLQGFLCFSTTAYVGHMFVSRFTFWREVR